MAAWPHFRLADFRATAQNEQPFALLNLFSATLSAHAANLPNVYFRRKEVIIN
jgi:hypothetical protein